LGRTDDVWIKGVTDQIAVDVQDWLLVDKALGNPVYYSIFLL
jgi:hypothetical protein